jgi:hypothetical protein
MLGSRLRTLAIKLSVSFKIPEQLNPFEGLTFFADFAVLIPVGEGRGVSHACLQPSLATVDIPAQAGNVERLAVNLQQNRGGVSFGWK